MTMNLNPIDSDIQINPALMVHLAERRKRTWLISAPIVFFVLVVIQLFLQPQTYTATASLLLQLKNQPSESSLAVLTGQSSQNNDVVGILESRRLAEDVAKHCDIQKLYHVKKLNDVIKMLQQSILVKTDSSTGLINVSCSLLGPARFAFGESARREEVRQLSAKVTNLYILALERYYSLHDNSRDSVLRRNATAALKQAQERFDNKSNLVFDYISGLKQDSPLSQPEAEPFVVVNELYATEFKDEAELKGAEAAQSDRMNGIKHQLGNIQKLPIEDPFLQQERLRVQEAAQTYHELVDVEQLAPENPSVVEASERLKRAQNALDLEEKGYKTNITSNGLEATNEIGNLKASLAAIQNELKNATRHIPTQRERSFQLSLLQTQQKLALSWLTQTQTEVVKVRLSTVPGPSRVTELDKAIPPKTGVPGLIRVVILSLFISVLLMLVQLLYDYLKHQSIKIHADSAAYQTLK